MISNPTGVVSGNAPVAVIEPRMIKYARMHPWHLKLDIWKYFESILRERLISRLHRVFKDREALYWLEQIVGRRRRDTAEGEDRILTNAPTSAHGLPIGSLTSQHLATFIGMRVANSRPRLVMG
jgi:hypothetical protein